MSMSLMIISWTSDSEVSVVLQPSEATLRMINPLCYCNRRLLEI